MAVSTLDIGKYAELLKEVHPTPPHSEEENAHLLAIVDELTERPELSAEEAELLEVLLALIERFENQHYATREAKPHEVLREMMRARNLAPKDLYEVFGSKGTTSEVLRGKRPISKNAARALAELFHISPARFL